MAASPKPDRDAFRSATTLNQQAEALFLQGKYTLAQPLAEKACETYRRLLTDDHPLTSAGYEGLSALAHAQGKYAEARALAEKALEIDRRVLREDHPQTADSLFGLASILAAQGKFAETRPLLEKALEINRRLLGDEDPRTLKILNNLALNLEDLGKTAEAQPLLEKALAIKRRTLGDDHPSTAATYTNLAANLNVQGKYAEALPLTEKALEINRQLLGDDHPSTATCYNNTWYNLEQQGKHAEAQPFIERSLEIDRGLFGDNHPQTARSYINLANSLNAQGKLEEAQRLYVKSLEISRRLLTDEHPSTAVGYQNLANNLRLQKKFGEAQPLFEKALEIRRRLLGEDHPQTARIYEHLATNLANQGRYGQAESLARKGLEIRRRLLGEADPETAESHGKLAAILHAEGRYAEAREQWLTAANGRDAARLRIAFTGLERAGVEEWIRPPLAALQARLGEPGEAWQTLEEDLGRGLLDDLAARQDRRLAPADQARLHELTAELDRLDTLMEATPDKLDQAARAKRFEELKHRRDLASIALGEYLSRLMHDQGRRAGRVALLDEIQAALPADAALVAWVDVPPLGPAAAVPDGEHWGVVVRSRDVPSWIAMPGTGPDRRWTEDDTGLSAWVRAELRNRPGGRATDTQVLVERLRARRFLPLMKALGATTVGLPAARRLIVLPSRAMAGIPVEALLEPDDVRTVSYAPSASVFRYQRERPRPARDAGLLAVGDPVFDRPESARAQDAAARPRPAGQPGHARLERGRARHQAG